MTKAYLRCCLESNVAFGDRATQPVDVSIECGDDGVKMGRLLGARILLVALHLLTHVAQPLGMEEGVLLESGRVLPCANQERAGEHVRAV